jgi:hypothetical protein
MEFLIRLAKDEKISQQEIKDLIEKNKQINEHLEERTLSNATDRDFIRKTLKL